MIEIKNLKFKYHQDQPSYILDDVSFHVKRGEWLSVVGHNGSGKIVAMRPSILILDEATSMLDPEGRQELIQSIKAIRKEYGMTVLSITHDLNEVALSDRVLVLKKGKVESVSSPRELFSRGSELVDLGLDIPFSALLTQKLRNKGLIDCEDYLTEKELVEQLWESLSKM